MNKLKNQINFNTLYEERIGGPGGNVPRLIEELKNRTLKKEEFNSVYVNNIAPYLSSRVYYEEIIFHLAKNNVEILSIDKMNERMLGARMLILDSLYLKSLEGNDLDFFQSKSIVRTKNRIQNNYISYDKEIKALMLMFPDGLSLDEFVEFSEYPGRIE